MSDKKRRRHLKMVHRGERKWQMILNGTWIGFFLAEGVSTDSTVRVPVSNDSTATMELHMTTTPRITEARLDESIRVFEADISRYNLSVDRDSLAVARELRHRRAIEKRNGRCAECSVFANSDGVIDHAQDCGTGGAQ